MFAPDSMKATFATREKWELDVRECWGVPQARNGRISLHTISGKWKIEGETVLG